MSLQNIQEIKELIRISTETGKIQRGQDLIKAYRADMIPTDILYEFGKLIEQWGDGLLASGRGNDALLKFELALEIFRKAVSSSGSGEISEGNDISSRLEKKIEAARE